MRPALSRLSCEISEKLRKLGENGLFKTERIIHSRQGIRVMLENKREVLNFCANNYLGLSAHPAVVKGAIEMTTSHGNGLSSVRFICGTQDIHKDLEKKISNFHSRDDAILYISCFDANAGLFTALFDENDAILSDELNHASIIDGIRLSKANKAVYKHRNMQDLEQKLKELCPKYRNIIIVSDGVFSMDGNIAPLNDICDLAEKYEALTFIDDCHATGFIGDTGRGTEEYCKVQGRVDIINSTLGKALGGAAGGYTVSSMDIINYLRQISRPYLFSNNLPPSLVGGALAAFNLIEKDCSMIETLRKNTKLFRTKMTEAGFSIIGDDHPICPVMMPDETTSVEFAEELLKKDIYVIGFTYPVVPRGKARIRVQISASHTTDDIEKAISSFIDIGKKTKIIQHQTIN